MSYIKILNHQEKNEVEKKLNEQFGIESVQGLILRTGEERLFLFSGDFSEKNIKRLEGTVMIERTGIYFAKIIHDKIKLSIEGTQILGAQIKKNLFELKDEKQLEEWMMGQDLPIQTGKRDFLVVKYKDDFLGCGKASEDKIGNFIPKSRRLKNRQS